jgi:hypothetical protein
MNKQEECFAAQEIRNSDRSRTAADGRGLAEG